MHSSKENNFKILKVLLRGFFKGLAKGALAAAVITLITGGAGLIAFPLVLLIMGLTQGVKEAIDYKVALNLSSNMEKNKAYIIFDSLWNFISTLGFSILTLGTSLVKDLVSGSLGLIKGAYLWLWRNEPQSSLKEYYKEREPGFQWGYTYTLFFLAIGAAVSSHCSITLLPYTIMIMGGGCLLGAILGGLTGRYCGKKNDFIKNDNVNAAVLGAGAIAAVCLVLAPFSLGLSILAGLAIIGTTMVLTRIIVFIKVFYDTKMNQEVVQKIQPSKKKTSTNDSTTNIMNEVKQNNSPDKSNGKTLSTSEDKASYIQIDVAYIEKPPFIQHQQSSSSSPLTCRRP